MGKIKAPRRWGQHSTDKMALLEARIESLEEQLNLVKALKEQG